MSHKLEQLQAELSQARQAIVEWAAEVCSVCFKKAKRVQCLRCQKKIMCTQCFVNRRSCSFCILIKVKGI